MPPPLPILSADKIVVGARPASREAAIQAVGNLLVSAGHVSSAYVSAMLAREQLATTYLGNGVAIPHGTREALAFVHAPGLAILQVPGGVDFGGGHTARLVIGLAARDDSHLDLLTAIAEVCSDDTQLQRLLSARQSAEILAQLESSLPA
ncbi:PTS sugar transporter subunit IIA [Opitutus sp. ER46]|uniref:PTS sugar transporter subunit IIA n=1 Tax=Opitutus sp. ER46 TaxID=2161864 RepID=UPI000D30F9CF|nr:PTS sugar transporter subunit IIA [Opitutus sp. ER46]PTX90982.1 PTS mannitol transporter subunit IIA [Opitutus sp. ER46]